MGTSDAYGGGKAKAWNDVRDAWRDLDAGDVLPMPRDGDGPRGPPDDVPSDPAGDDGQTPPGSDPSPLGRVGRAIAQALLEGVPRRQDPPPLSSLIARGGGSGGGGGGPAGSSSAQAGGAVRRGRRILLQAARGGAAIGAATAYRDRDEEALRAYGISLDELDGLGPRTRCARLLDLVLGDAGHPDEAAIRKAAAQQMKKILNMDTLVRSALESVRAFIGELVLQLGLVELRDQILANNTTGHEATRKERNLRQWIAAKIRQLDLGRYGIVTSTDCHRAAHDMTRDALRLLAAT